MKIIISEDQYEFLKYGYGPRLEYMKTFELDLQDMIDENMDTLLSFNNGKENFTEIIDLIVDEDIRLGIGNRAYDVTILALVKKSEKKFYFINGDAIEWTIRNMIKDKYGFKTSVKLEIVLDSDDNE